MDNDEKKPRIIQPVEKNETEPVGDAPPAPAREAVRFEPFDWLAVALGIALGALWFEVFDLVSLMAVPGLGQTAFVLGALGAECVYLRGKLRPTKQGLFLTACTVLLAIASGLFGDYSVRMINLALLACLTPASALALTGREFPALELSVIPETIRLFIPNLFRHFLKPFQALRGGRKAGGAFWAAILTLVLMIPVFAIVLTLLAGADQVFSAVLGDVGAFFSDTLWRGRFLWRWVKSAVFGLMLFSFLYSLARPAKLREAFSSGVAAFPCLPCIVGLTALDIIYAVFAVIQFVFLFGGAETAAMQGGFAQYARQGFFQLVAVAGINLGAALLCADSGGKGKRLVNLLVYVLVGLTAVILVSAVYRMCLYIGVYGLSLLRCGTIIIMAWIAVALFAATIKTARPGFKVFPVFVTAFLVLWLVFNYVNIDAVIADWNRTAFERGQISEYDAGYISTLGPSREQNASAPWQNKVAFPRSE